MHPKLFINQAFYIIFLINFLVSLGLRVMYASDKFVYANVIIQRYGKFKHPIYLGHLDTISMHCAKTTWLRAHHRSRMSWPTHTHPCNRKVQTVSNLIAKLYKNSAMHQKAPKLYEFNYDMSNLSRVGFLLANNQYIVVLGQLSFSYL